MNYGRWQVSILSKLQSAPEGYFVSDLLPADYTRAEYEGLHEAKRRLAEVGEIKIQKRRPGDRGQWRDWILPGRKIVSLPPARVVYARVVMPVSYSCQNNSKE